jgi:hypothetical protein
VNGITLTVLARSFKPFYTFEYLMLFPVYSMQQKIRSSTQIGKVATDQKNMLSERNAKENFTKISFSEFTKILYN